MANIESLIRGKDSTGEYLATRQDAQMSPAQQRILMQAGEAEQEEDPVPFSFSGALETFTGVTSDIAEGLIIEAPRQIVGGVLDATKELAQFMESIIPLGTLGGGEVTEESFIQVAPARTVTGGLVRGVSQFLTGFLPALKGLKVLGVGGQLVRAATAGAAADALVFDPHEARLSNLIEENEALKNPVTEYLAAQPDDTDAEGRFKNAIEGLGLGALADGLFRAVKVLRTNKIARDQERSRAKDKETATRLTQEPKADPGEAIPAGGEPQVLDDIGQRLNNKIKRDFDGAVAEYNSRPDAEGGKVLNTDIARELSPEYLRDRSLSANVHEPASQFIKDRYAQILKEAPKPGEENTILFTAGGTGSGKTTAIDAINGTDNVQAVYDTNFAKFDSADLKINQALDAGKDVNIAYVFRDPVEAFEDGALSRSINQAKKFGTGRTVPIVEHIKTHKGSMEVIKKLTKKYKDDPRVNIVILDNSFGKGNSKVSSIDILKEQDYNKVEVKINSILEKAHAEGKITDETYRGFKGRLQDQGKQKVPGVRGQPKQERSKEARDERGMGREDSGQPKQKLNEKEVNTPDIVVTKADRTGASNINLNNLETSDDVKRLINDVAEVDALNINEARREVITNEVTERLADDLGMTVDDLLDRQAGQSFNAEQALAARKILVASGESLFNLARLAATGNDKEVLIFRKAMAQHQAIQQQVSGLTAEAGRALQSFRIRAKGAKAQEQGIKDALEAGGGIEFSKDIAYKIAQLEDMNQLGTFVRQAERATKPQMIYEAWINGLLSSPATHVVNVLSNSMVSVWSVGERKVASLIGDAFGGQSIPEGEASAQLKGMIEGTKDGLRLAWKALKTGVPSDPLQKIENQGRRAISAENLELSGVPGRFADFLGEAVRVPGRLLTAGDELFKTMGYRMELNAQAYRTAYNEGLRGEDLAVRMAGIIKNPPENIHLEAVNAGRYQTFTKELGAAGKAVEQVRGKVPGARLVDGKRGLLIK